MWTKSYVLNKSYDSDKVVYILNQTQFLAYMLNEGGQYLVDIIPDPTKGKLIYVFERCDGTAELYKAWNKKELNYKPIDAE